MTQPIILPPGLAQVAQQDALERAADAPLPQPNVIELGRPCNRALISTQQQVQWYGDAHKGFMYRLIIEITDQTSLNANDHAELEQFALEMRRTPTTPEMVMAKMIRKWGERDNCALVLNGVIVGDGTQTEIKLVCPPRKKNAADEKSAASA